MVFSGMLHHVALVRMEELSASFIRVTRIGELGTTLAVTSNRQPQMFKLLDHNLNKTINLQTKSNGFLSPPEKHLDFKFLSVQAAIRTSCEKCHQIYH
jgi:hypothetical protein